MSAILPLHRGFVTPAPVLRFGKLEFLVITTQPGEEPQERTVWSNSAAQVAIDTIERLKHEGCEPRVRIEVRVL